MISLSKKEQKKHFVYNGKAELRVILFLLIILSALKLSRFSKIVKQEVERALKPIMLAQILI